MPMPMRSTLAITSRRPPSPPAINSRQATAAATAAATASAFATAAVATRAPSPSSPRPPSPPFPPPLVVLPRLWLLLLGHPGLFPPDGYLPGVISVWVELVGVVRVPPIEHSSVDSSAGGAAGFPSGGTSATATAFTSIAATDVGATAAATSTTLAGGNISRAVLASPTTIFVALSVLNAFDSSSPSLGVINIDVRIRLGLRVGAGVTVSDPGPEPAAAAAAAAGTAATATAAAVVSAVAAAAVISAATDACASAFTSAAAAAAAVEAPPAPAIATGATTTSCPPDFPGPLPPSIARPLFVASLPLHRSRGVFWWTADRLITATTTPGGTPTFVPRFPRPPGIFTEEPASSALLTVATATTTTATATIAPRVTLSAPTPIEVPAGRTRVPAVRPYPLPNTPMRRRDHRFGHDRDDGTVMRDSGRGKRPRSRSADAAQVLVLANISAIAAATPTPPTSGSGSAGAPRHPAAATATATADANDEAAVSFTRRHPSPWVSNPSGVVHRRHFRRGGPRPSPRNGCGGGYIHTR